MRKLTELIDSIRIGLLTTVDLDGRLHTRAAGDAAGPRWLEPDLAQNALIPVSSRPIVS